MMNFVEAKQEIFHFQRFFRALKTLEDVLDTAIEADNKITQSESTLNQAKDELASITAKLNDLKPKYNKMKSTFDTRQAEFEANLEAQATIKKKELDAEVGKLNLQIKKKEAELSKLDDAHKKSMEDFAAAEKLVQDKIDAVNAKLVAAQKAYEDFKKGL